MVVFAVVFICLSISSAVGPAVRNLTSISTYRNSTGATVSHERFKRQSQCGLYKWQCSDGTCISIDGECDGKIDCPDKSDETHARCRNRKCQSNWFRCTYGACVDGNAPCNNHVECADESDELLPRCRNDARLKNGKFRCLDDSIISTENFCDGVLDCPDGSDENIRACADKTCPGYLFQCAYGACVDQGSACNGTNECADGSDEAAELCNGKKPSVEEKRPVLSGQCKLPPFPDHGTYTTNIRNSRIGQVVPYVTLNISCEEGYGFDGDSVVFCQGGKFSTKNGQIPQCVPFCKLDSHISVHYRCQLSGPNTGSRPCRSAEPVGTVVRPECTFPIYFSNEIPYMRCQSDGTWNRNYTCRPECGRLTPSGKSLIINGTAANRGQVPWHVAIYRKPTQVNKKYELICGGSIVSNSVVISAAHCFWASGRLQAASKYSVATAKLFSEWDHPDDEDVQKSELKSIKVTEYFKGSLANFQSDLAVLILETPFVYYTYVRPVCLSFRSNLMGPELEKGVLGKVAGFGLTGETGSGSPALKVVDLPYVPIKECFKVIPEYFTEYLTQDKICAGYTNGTAALCKGDSGGGLCFPEKDSVGTTRFYLRGVTSSAPNSKETNDCNPYTVIAFTKIDQNFINQFL